MRKLPIRGTRYQRAKNQSMLRYRIRGSAQDLQMPKKIQLISLPRHQFNNNNSNSKLHLELLFRQWRKLQTWKVERSTKISLLQPKALLITWDHQQHLIQPTIIHKASSTSKSNSSISNLYSKPNRCRHHSLKRKLSNSFKLLTHLTT